MFYAATFFVLLTLLLLFLDIWKPRHYPPGPRWYPILGNALQISKLRLKYGMFCKVIEELNKVYDGNGIVGLKIGKDKLVVTYTCEAIKEMMTNEDLDGRPTGPFYETRTFGTRKGILLTDEDFWQEQRRFLMRHLKDFGFARRGMIDIIQNEAQHLVNDFKNIIQEQGGNGALIPMQELFGVYILNTLWSMLAGIRYDRNNKELKQLLQMFYELFKNIDMVGCLFSHFPFLRFIAPKSSGYADFVDIHRRVYEFLGREVENHKRNFRPGDEPRDLMDSYLQVLAQPNYKPSFSEQQLLAICLDMFLAGSETTNKSLGFAFLHMVRDPTIQDRVQEELDAVVGRERFPCWDDKPNLPYCDAVVHEAIRFFMGNTFGIPHRALRDTRLCGYNIPKNTMVIGCFRGMLMNEKNFADPEKFRPERFLKDGKLVLPENFAPFGIGRHRCMGEVMGKQNLFMFITTLLQNFRFLNPEGQPLPDSEPVDGATASAKPFTAFIIPRLID